MAVASRAGLVAWGAIGLIGGAASILERTTAAGGAASPALTVLSRVAGNSPELAKINIQPNLWRCRHNVPSGRCVCSESIYFD